MPAWGERACLGSGCWDPATKHAAFCPRHWNTVSADLRQAIDTALARGRTAQFDYLMGRAIARLDDARPLPAEEPDPLSRSESEAIHRKLDLILEGQKTIMAQQDELMDALTAIGSEVSALKDHATDLETKLAAKADDLGIDLSPEITLAKAIRAKLEGVATAVSTPVGDTPTGPDPDAAPATPAVDPAIS